MILKHRIRSVVDAATYPFFRFTHRNAEQFCCPICGYAGPFKDYRSPVGSRKFALCPKCHAFERHRLQWLVANDVLKTIDPAGKAMLHIAPESFFADLFKGRFASYDTADLYERGVDFRVDLQDMPFEDASYDLVYASHVLEHVPDDRKALSEVRRVLRPGGIAILPVPVIAEKTVEYPAANPNEAYHVRAPGMDYFERYDSFFSEVRLYRSEDYPASNQLFIYEDRSGWPTEECPNRPAMKGERFEDVVPVCRV